MTPFSGTLYGKLDSKGRIAIPASFRSVMERNGSTELAFRVSHLTPCIEAHTETAFNAMVEAIRAMPQFSRERQVMEGSIIARTTVLRVDADGRVMLPERMLRQAGIGGALAFLGKGDRFEIWDEAKAEAHLEGADGDMRELAYTVPPLPLHTTPRGMP
jgi:MraZ protein